MALVVGLDQVEAGRGVVREEQLALELGVDLDLPTDQGVFGREPSVSRNRFKLQFTFIKNITF